MVKIISNNKLILGLFFICSTFVYTWAQSSVPFPKDYANGVVYFKNDRGSITEDVLVDKSVIKTIQSGKPIQIGTTITLVEYFSKNEKGADGYALKGDLKRYVVMRKEKITALTKKSGGWKYQAFNPNKTIKNEDLDRCVSCHDSAKGDDYVYTLGDMKQFNLSN